VKALRKKYNKMMRDGPMRWLAGGVLVLLFFGVGFLLTPSPVDSEGWLPPLPLAMTGQMAPNERLQQAKLLAKGQVYGPEDTAVDADGVLYAGTQDGLVVRLFPDGRLETWVDTDGRPLGMTFDTSGNLIVADAWKGLLSIAPDKTVTVLSTEAEGVPFRFTDDVDVAPDGAIYFTDASSRFNQPDYQLDLLEMRPHGRFMKYSPETGKTTVLLGNLYFANGVAVSPTGDYVLINETWRYRILRYWLRGPKAGQSDVFADNLPGFPDNLSVDNEGRVWVAFPTLRNAQMDNLHPVPWLKNLVAKLPDSFKPAPQQYGLVVAFAPDGTVIASLHDTHGTHLQEITSVNPHGGYLYFGSLHNDRIGRLSLRSIPELGDDDK
jgi:sugar lactone lactonase YvrE